MPIRLRTPLILTAIYAVAAATMFGWLMPAVVSACGRPPLDGLVTWQRADAQTLATACGETGFQAYSRLAVFDLIYPLAFALCVGTWIVWLSGRLARSRSIAVLLLVPVALNTIFDYLENTAVWTLLREGASSDSLLLDIGGTFSTAKDIAGMLSLITVAVLAVVTIIVAARRRAVSAAPALP